MIRNLNAALTIAFRDLMKFLRDRGRIIGTLIFPFLVIPIFGGTLNASFGASIGFDYMAFIFTGMLAQTLFQSSAFGIISLITDRESDFSQTVFVAPISRYTIIFGKILGESLVALTQGLGILIFARLVGVQYTAAQVVALIPVAIAICLFGGAFGVIVLSNMGSRRSVDQLFNFIMLPQFFLAGVFNPIRTMPPVVDFLSRISPLRYAVDLTRDIFYLGRPDEYSKVILQSPLFNLAIMGGLFAIFLAAGTAIFVRQERNR